MALVDLKIMVSNSSGGGNPVVVDATGVPQTAQAGAAFNGVLKASGGNGGPYVFTDVSAAQTPPGSFPTGLTLNADGTITGIVDPNVPDQTLFDATVQVTDSAGNQSVHRVRSSIGVAQPAGAAAPLYDSRTGARIR